ncbi:MAG: PAS domain S-box protein [Elusimicrobia bacterium]|nr:PAS domain S-box protein [Elusimicrobiota bacterium]
MKTIKDVMQVADAAVVVADQQGAITYVNESFSEVFGWDGDEILGRSLTTIIPKDLHDAHHLGFSRFLTTGAPTLLSQPLKLKAIAKDVRVFDAEHFIVAELRDGLWTFAATIRPLST